MALTINHQTNDISATSGSVTIDGASAGGAWNLISTTEVSTSTSSIEFTGLSGYTTYALKVGYNTGFVSTAGDIQVLFGASGTYATTNYLDQGSSGSEWELFDTGTNYGLAIAYIQGLNAAKETLGISLGVSFNGFYKIEALVHTTATAYDSIKLQPSTGTFESGFKVSVYGVSG
jgi:hypothetical protein